MLLRAWVRRTVALPPNPAMAPGPWQLVAEGEDREELALFCRQHHPGREFVILKGGEAPVKPTAKGG